jgi:uncharacterized membrane protein
METARPRARRLLSLPRIVRARPRLFSAGALGAVVGAAATVTSGWASASCFLVGWDVAVGVYLGLALQVMASSDVESIRRHAALQDEGQLGMLVLTVAAAMASLAAIVVELGVGTGRPRLPSHLAGGLLTIFLSWAFIHTIFALHYAHEFYDEEAGGGMAFPGSDGDPDYWDFAYFAFVIGMTSQVSDVSVTSKRIRRTVAAHGIVSFLFNAALLALSVNIAASVV